MNPCDTSTAPRSLSRTPEQLNAIALAKGRRAAMLRRARRIRRSVATFAAALFCGAFLVIYVQLASGHDPALVADAKRASAAALTASGKSTSVQTTAAASAASAAAGTPSGGTSSSGATANDESSSGSGTGKEETSTASAVTTSQS